MRIWILQVRKEWEGSFGDYQSCLKFHSAHLTKESAELTLRNTEYFHIHADPDWDWSISEVEVQE